MASLGGHSCSHLLWWPLLCCLRGISFCSSSAVSSSSYSCYGCCQLLLSLLGVSVQLVLVQLRFFHSVSCGWLPFWGSPAGCSFTRGRPYGKRSSSSSRSGGRQRFRGVWGGGLLLPALRVSVGGYHLLSGPLSGSCLSLHWQAWRDAAGGLLSALPQHSSSFQCSHPNAFFQPHLHQGGCSGGGHLGLHCQGCCGPYPLTSADFYSRLFVVWKTSGSWRPVIDLSHLIRFVDVSPFWMGTIQSVLLSVRQGDWMASIDLMEAYLQVPVPPVSRHFLRFMFRDTVYQFKALCFGLSMAPQVFTRVLAPVSALLHSMGVPYETVSRQLASPVNLSGVPSRGSSDCPPTLSRVGGLWSPPDFRPGSLTGGSVSGGFHRLHLFPGLYVGGALLPAAVDGRRVSVLRLAYLELLAIAPRRPFFAGSPSSWRQTVVEVPPTLPPSILGSSGSGGSSVCVDGVSSRPPVVAPSPSSVSRSVSLPGVPRPTLLVSRLRRGVGCPSRSSDRFRPVGRPPCGVLHKRQGTACYPTGSSPVPVFSTGSHGGCLLRQHHSSGFSSQGGWHTIPSPHHLGSGDLAMDSVPLHPPGSAVPPGLQQRPRGRPVSPSPAPTFNVVTTSARISIFEKSLAGPNSFICDI